MGLGLVGQEWLALAVDSQSLNLRRLLQNKTLTRSSAALTITTMA